MDLPLLLQDSKDFGKKEWKEQRAKQSRSDVKQGKWESYKDNYFGYLSTTFLFKLCITRTHCFWLSCCDAVSTKSSLAYYNIHYLACKTGYLIPHLSKISAIMVNWPSDSSMHGSIVHSSIISLAEIENLHWEVKEWSCGILRKVRPLKSPIKCCGD